MIRRGYALAPVVVAAGLATIVTACSSAQPVSTAPTRSRVSTPTTVQTTPDPTRDRPARRTRPAQHAPSTALPLGYRTAHARQVITVVAPSATSTQASLQAWRAVSGGWRRVGPAVPAWLGAAGFSEHASESVSATPTGSFTLTRAFGHDRDPGTALPYRRTTPDDWWISQAGPLYNTLQRCSGTCSFTQGDPNEHLYYETPYYDYAVVIDYNTRNSPTGVRQGLGSAFFLHVTVHAPTAGCVSVPKRQLVRLLRWLKPGEHPRILLGVRSTGRS